MTRSTSFATFIFALLWLVTPSVAQTVVTVGPTSDDNDDTPSTAEATFEASSPEGAYHASGARMDVRMPADVGREAIIVSHPRGEAEVRMQQLAAVQRDAAGEELARHEPRPSSATLVDPQTVRYAELYPGVDDEYILSADRLKHDWVLASQPTLPARTTWYGYEVRLTLPAQATLEGDPVEGYLVVDDEGDALYELPPVVAVDAAGREITGQYRILANEGAEIRLAVEVAATWLMNATYPVRIDPTIITVDGPNTMRNSFPWSNNDPWTYQQTYSAAQLQNTAGTIERIGFDFNGPFDKTWSPARIYMGETSYDSNTRSMTFDDNFNVVSKTLVYDGSLNLQHNSPGYLMFSLQTPFQYSGQETLVIQIELAANPSGSGSSNVRRESGSSSAPVECYRLWNRASSSETTATNSTDNFYLHARFEISTGPVIDTTSLPEATEGFAYSETLQASGGTTPYTWSATGLPAGLSLDPSSGEISGTPDSADVGSHTVDVTLTDDNNDTDDETFTLDIGPAVSVDSVELPEGTATGDYPTLTATTSGGVGPFVWSADGLPAGLEIDANTGEISGTLEAGTAGSHSVEVTATDTNSDSDTYVTTLVVNAAPTIITEILPRVTPNEPWGPHPIEHEGGTAPLTFSAADLPEGLELDTETGEVSGEVEHGVISSETRFEATVTDAHGVTHTQEIGFLIHTLGAGSGGCDCSTTHARLDAGQLLPSLALAMLLLLFSHLRRLHRTAQPRACSGPSPW